MTSVDLLSGQTEITVSGARAALRELLAQRSYQFLPAGIKLSSGRISHDYVDAKLTVNDPVGFECTGRLLVEVILRFAPDAVAGLEVGALPLAFSVLATKEAKEKHIRALWIRKKPKEYGFQKPIEGDLKGVRSVVVVDDVVTTGESTLQAVRRLKEAGIDVKAVVALVDREEGGREAIEQSRIPFHPIFTLEELKRASESKDS